MAVPLQNDLPRLRGGAAPIEFAERNGYHANKPIGGARGYPGFTLRDPVLPPRPGEDLGRVGGKTRPLFGGDAQWRTGWRPTSFHACRSRKPRNGIRQAA